LSRAAAAAHGDSDRTSNGNTVADPDSNRYSYSHSNPCPDAHPGSGIEYFHAAPG
jgi:hypothetical protein